MTQTAFVESVDTVSDEKDTDENGGSLGDDCYECVNFLEHYANSFGDDCDSF